jgi:hypothetical protein
VKTERVEMLPRMVNALAGAGPGHALPNAQRYFVLVTRMFLLGHEGMIGTLTANAKQLIISTSLQDQVLVDLAVDGTSEVLNVALAALSEIPGVKDISVVHISQQS